MDQITPDTRGSSASPQSAVDIAGADIESDVDSFLGLPAAQPTGASAQPGAAPEPPAASAPTGNEDPDGELEPQLDPENPEPDPEAGTQGEEEASRKTPVQKRIDELTAARKTAEERAQSLEAQVATVQQQLQIAQQALAQRHAGPDQLGIDEIADPVQFAQRKAQVEQTLEHWQGVLESNEELDPQGNASELTPERKRQVQGFVRDLKRHMQHHIPQREAFFTERAQLEQQAIARLPWLKDAQSAKFKLAQQLLAKFPEIGPKRNRAYALLIGYAVEGHFAQQQQAKGPAVQPRVPAAPHSAPAAPVVRPTQQRKQAAAAHSKRFAETGSEEDLVAALEAELP